MSEEHSTRVVHEDADGYGVRVRQSDLHPRGLVVEEYDPDGPTQQVNINYDEVDKLHQDLKELMSE